jgi:hypothetical protein
MSKFKPVSIPRYAFIFCRYGVAILVWLSLILRDISLIWVVFFILLLSAILKIGKAPMIFLYTQTIHHFIKSPMELVNEYAMRFAHTLGSVLAGFCLILFYLVNVNIAWVLVFFFAILKSVSAFGFCPASRLYECVGSGHCCALAKHKP